MSWSIRFTRTAERDLMRVAKKDQSAIKKALNRLILNPGSVDIVKLEGRRNGWRLRVGQWRIILLLENNTGTIDIVHIHPRKNAYRD